MENKFFAGKGYSVFLSLPAVFFGGEIAFIYTFTGKRAEGFNVIKSTYGAQFWIQGKLLYIITHRVTSMPIIKAFHFHVQDLIKMSHYTVNMLSYEQVIFLSADREVKLTFMTRIIDSFVLYLLSFFVYE